MDCKHDFSLIDDMYYCGKCGKHTLTPPNPKQNVDHSIIPKVITVIVIVLGGIFAVHYLNLSPDLIDPIVSIERQLGYDNQPITYDIAPIPQKIKNPSIPNMASQVAINSWDDINTKLQFTRDASNADITIKWVDVISGPLDTVYCENDKCVMTIPLGDTDCNGDYVQFDTNWVATIIMHNIGHILQLDHSNELTHLMFGLDDTTLDSIFDDKGFNIPNELQGGFVGQKQLERKIIEYDEQIKPLKEQLEERMTEYEKIIAESGYTEEYLRTNDDYPKSLKTELTLIINRINDYTIQTNELTKEQNKILDEYNCLSNTQ